MAESHGDEAQLLPVELPDVGLRLRLAREAAGLGRADIAAKTKIPERHIAAIEAGDFAALAGRSYALGFSRTYARAVGLDEREVSQAVRLELGDAPPEPEHRNAFEPGDPSRVPSKRVAWLAALIALGVAIGMLFFWRGRNDPVAEPEGLGLSSEEALSLPPASDAAIVPAALPTDALPATTAGLPPGNPAPVAARRAAPARLGQPDRPLATPAAALETQPAGAESAPAATPSTVAE